MKTINTEELKQKLEQGDSFKLLMTYNERAFRTAHIPGSLLLDTPEKAPGLIAPDDDIVVYCANENCQASIQAYHTLKAAGYQHISRYSAGIEGWSAAGLEVASD